ncbi:hypothetical protein CJU90_3245 [Yarrowia sp. C11]|nr:hypothetical protein CKK34_4692 [Yarrowia sp. E02]KAG5369731.1 hypothetical protein CJU90_3245 [Yarrowia sp. C11]
MGLIATILAVFWLLHRATRLLKIPATTLIRLLGVDIPERPEICVDHVSDSSVTLRWPKPEKSTAHKHIIEVNGIKAGESSRSTSVVLTNLQPDKTYSVNVLTVNANQYRSNTTTVRVHTRKKTTQHPSLDSLAPLLMDPVSPAFVVLSSGTTSASTTTASSTSGLSTATSIPSASGGLKHKKHKQGSAKKLSPDKSAYTVESLTAEVEAAQQEIRDANMQFREVEKELVAQENKLQEESQELRAQRKKDDVSRSHLRSEMKALEDQKVNIELHRAKVDKQLQNLEQTVKRMEVEESKWLNTSQIMERKTEDLTTTDTETYHENANKKVVEAETLQKALAAVEEEVKSMTAEIRQLDGLRKSLAEHGSSNCGNNNNNDTNNSSEALLKVLEDTADGKAEILRQQIHFDTDLDQKWRDVQRQLEQRYVQVYGEYGEATRLLESAKIQYQQFQVVASANSSQIIDNSASSFDFGSTSRDMLKNERPAAASVPAQPIPDAGRRPSTFEGDENFNTAVQMFLPSNLFGADDLNDSLTQSSFEAIEELPMKGPSYPSHHAQTSSPSSSFDAFRVSSEDPHSPSSFFAKDYDMDTSSPVTRPKRLSGMFGFNRKTATPAEPTNKGSLFFRNKRKQEGKELNDDMLVAPEAFDPFQASWNRSNSPGGNIFGPSFGTSEWSGSPSGEQDWSNRSVESYAGSGGPFAPGFKAFDQHRELYDDSADNAEPYGASSAHSEYSVMTDGSKDSNGRESIIQKGIRTLTSPRKGSSSSAKFNVGKLSFFGGKKSDRSDASSTDADTDDGPEQGALGAILETRSGTGSPHLNMEEFLKQT